MNSDQEKSEFGKRLREAMLDAGHVAKGGADSGVDASALFSALYDSREKGDSITPEMARRYTVGKAKPRDFRMKKIAKWLGVNFLWLKDGIGPKKGAESGALTDPKERKLIDVWREATEPERDFIMASVDTTAKAIAERRAKKKGA